MLKLVLGRDAETKKLRMTVNGKSMTTGYKGSVPEDISREHISIEIDDEGGIILKNLATDNDTYVNNIGIETKRIKQGDRIELGNSHYRIDWNDLSPFIPKKTDIRPLRKIWEEYNSRLKAIQQQQKTNGLLQSIPMGFTMFGTLISSIGPIGIRNYAIAFTIIAFAIFLIGIYRRFADKSIEEREKLTREFQHRYVCPNCGHFLGNQPYDLVTQNKMCPHCKAIYQK